MRPLRHTIHAVIRPGEDGGFVAECLEIAVVTQGKSLDETVANLRQAVGLHLAGEDLEALGLSPSPSLVVSMEIEPVHA
jgi:predicted RNase H-like HicB family nuclease